MASPYSELAFFINIQRLEVAIFSKFEDVYRDADILRLPYQQELLHLLPICFFGHHQGTD